MIESINIPKYKISYLQKAITKLNRKAKKLSCPEMILSFNNEHVVEYKDHPITGAILITPMIVEMVTANLEYEIPMIDGYELVATLDIFPGENENKVLISAVPDKVVPAAYQTKNEIHCDHCGWKRNRHHSVLLEKDGEYIEVGSTCVKDFFGGNDPRGFMFYASLRFEDIIGSVKDDDSLGYGGRGIWSYSLQEVLAHTSAVIRKHGWMSKGKAYEFGGEATAYRVVENIEPSPDVLNDPTLRKELAKIDDKDVELADLTYEYFENLDAGDNDYLLNCTKIADLGYVPYKYLGFACSMIPAYNRAMDEKRESENTVPSEWVGEIGQRLTNVRVKVVFQKHLETRYGMSTLYIFKDAQGCDYKTFYSGSSWEYDVDAEIMITGTIKKHDDYKGKKSTMINRVVAKDTPKDAIAVEEFSV